MRYIKLFIEKLYKRLYYAREHLYILLEVYSNPLCYYHYSQGTHSLAAMITTKVPPIYSDVPIRSSKEDRYSFTSVASGVVKHLKSNTSPESFVVGVTGQWGIGKTSMLNLIAEQYKLQQNDKEPVIVFNFSPLKDVDRDTMLSDFLLLLTNHVESELKNSKPPKTEHQKKIENLKNYAVAVQRLNTKLTPYFQILSTIGFSITENASKAIGTILNLLIDGQSPPNIEKLYKAAYESLLELKIPVIVLIDDIDRLYPSEIIGMLTLLRSTVQLPYITYYVSYDPIKVEEALTQELHSSGKDYLDKYIQTLISVPRVSKNTIRNLISDQVLVILGNLPIEDNYHSDTLHNIVYEVMSFFLNEGGIKTTRDAYKTINSIQMSGAILSHIRDCESFLKIAIIKLKYSKIYEWIENASWSYQNISQPTTEMNIPDLEKEKLDTIIQQDKLSQDFRKEVIKLVSTFENWKV